VALKDRVLNSARQQVDQALGQLQREFHCPRQTSKMKSELDPNIYSELITDNTSTAYGTIFAVEISGDWRRVGWWMEQANVIFY